MDEIKTKVCKICGEEKPLNQFNSKGKGFTDTKCKVCGFLDRRNIKYDNKLIENEDRLIIDYLLNKKCETINEIADMLNKDLKELCFRILNILKVSGQVETKIKLKCPVCEKDFITYPNIYLNDDKNHFCSKECFNIWLKDNFRNNLEDIEKICENCGKYFTTKKNNIKQRFCCIKCKEEYYRLNPSQEEIICINCGKSYVRRRQPRKGNNYCSLECELEFKHNQHWETRICEICGEEYECKKISTQRFCSIQCQAEWQRNTLIGENAVGYKHEFSFEDRTIECQWCGKNFQVKPYQIDSSKKFCSKECRQEWYSKEFSQTDEWKKYTQQRAVQMLENGVFNHTNTECQTLVNEFLDELNINYTNEKGFNYCAVDNYLFEHNLIIEVMGTYWHTDNRFYNQINYERQVNRIRMDKIKHINIKKDYNIEILYLWEYDIFNNQKICFELIKNYVTNKGILKNYHSFNYTLNENKKIVLNNNLIIPYMEWDIKDLNNIIDTTTKEKMSRKQPDRWIAFNCEYCGKEKEELIGHYNTTNHHYCSKECTVKAQITRVKVKCNNCGKEIEVIRSKYNKNKRFFCDQECQHEYQKRVGFRRDNSDLVS